MAPGTYPALENPDPVTLSVRTSSGCSAATRVPTMPPSLQPSRSTGPRSRAVRKLTVWSVMPR